MRKTVKNDNLDDFNVMLAIIKEYCKFGKLTSIDFYDEDEESRKTYLKSFKTYNDFVSLYSAAEYKQADSVRAVYLDNNLESFLVLLNKKSKCITLSYVPKKEILQNKKSTSNDFIQDAKCTYYKFTSGVIAKYNPNDELYYSLDKNGNWVIDNRILPWIIGAEYDYTEIKKKSEKTR